MQVRSPVCTLKDEHTHCESDNWVLSGILDPNREEETDSRIELHNKGFDDLYSSQNIIGMIRSMRMTGAGHVVCLVLIRKSEGKRLFG